MMIRLDMMYLSIWAYIYIYLYYMVDEMDWEKFSRIPIP